MPDVCEGDSAENGIMVTVRTMSGGTVGTFEVQATQPVSSLMQDIAEKGGPAPWDQKLVASHRVLGVADLAGAVLRDCDGIVFLVTVAGCPTCKGPCSCTLCHCRPAVGLIDYFGVCNECKRCGGHYSKCPFCLQTFPSLRACDIHVRMIHPDSDTDLSRMARVKDDIQKRGSLKVPAPEDGTWTEAVRGGL
eukprot:TRINITY_DN56024_c0_g1_i1.p1 TRINITY_DN56024_c0_g1~~TRINITY_DN56024_c0_g1_i1.p1  ORF type:complete len:192 (-),score=28.21 TRINITY_DN56024_c0_g1_i1:114-689(-)